MKLISPNGIGIPHRDGRWSHIIAYQGNPTSGHNYVGPEIIKTLANSLQLPRPLAGWPGAVTTETSR